MTLAEVLKKVRLKCLDCTCHQADEIKECTVTACSLWELRFGKNPTPNPNRGNANALKEYHAKRMELQKNDHTEGGISQ